MAEQGWYPDPSNDNYERFWDGHSWTERTRLRSQISTHQDQLRQRFRDRQRKFRRRRLLEKGLGYLLAGLGIGLVLVMLVWLIRPGIFPAGAKTARIKTGQWQTLNVDLDRTEAEMDRYHSSWQACQPSLPREYVLCLRKQSRQFNLVDIETANQRTYEDLIIAAKTTTLPCAPRAQRFAFLFREITGDFWQQVRRGQLPAKSKRLQRARRSFSRSCRPQ